MNYDPTPQPPKWILEELSVDTGEEMSLPAVNKMLEPFDIRYPSERQEYWHLCFHVLDYLGFFKDLNYSYSLPENFVAEFPKDSGSSLWGNDAAFESFRTKVRDNDVSNHEQVVSTLADAVRPLLKACMPFFDKWRSEGWFRLFERYLILPVAWGTGGSYSYDQNNFPGGGKDIATVFVVAGATFSFQNTITNCIHEIVHLGIEETLIKSINRTEGIELDEKHNLKERLVDMLCDHILPEGYGYRMQKRGDSRIDDSVRNYFAGNSPSLAEDIERFAVERSALEGH